jgi:hypothetical protein
MCRGIQAKFNLFIYRKSLYEFFEDLGNPIEVLLLHLKLKRNSTQVPSNYELDSFDIFAVLVHDWLHCIYRDVTDIIEFLCTWFKLCLVDECKLLLILNVPIFVRRKGHSHHAHDLMV